MSFETVSIRTKLIAAFSMLALLFVGIGLLGLRATRTMREQMPDIETNWLPSVRVLGEIDTLGDPPDLPTVGADAREDLPVRPRACAAAGRATGGRGPGAR